MNVLTAFQGYRHWVRIICEVRRPIGFYLHIWKSHQFKRMPTVTPYEIVNSRHLIHINRSIYMIEVISKQKLIDSLNQIMMAMIFHTSTQSIAQPVNKTQTERQTNKNIVSLIVEFSSTLDYSRVTTHLTVISRC